MVDWQGRAALMRFLDQSALDAAREADTKLEISPAQLASLVGEVQQVCV